MPRNGDSNHSTKRLTIEDMHKTARKMGGKCLSVDYITCQIPLTWQCVKGHIWQAAPSNIRSGYWCPVCSHFQKLTLAEMQKIAAHRGGKCLSTVYANAHTKLTWQCAKGHVWRAKPEAVKRGTWCQKCHLEKIHKKGDLKMKKTLTLKNDFHNTTVNLKVDHVDPLEVGDFITLTDNQVRKAKNALCCSDCICSGELGDRADWHQLGDSEVKFQVDVKRDRNGKLTGADLIVERIFLGE